MHLDGARIFNALVKTKEAPEAYGDYFDTISVCFSKGLGAPIGSAILGTKDAIRKARRVRKVFGGAMRQVGYLAAACIYALDHHVDRLVEDHQRAKTLASFFESKSFITKIYPLETNIVILKIDPDFGIEKLLNLLKSKGLLAVPFGKNEIRLVTHLDYTDSMLEKSEGIISSI
jgi:threonine aldolase